MTALVWDAAGSKFYQTGIDRGVLYLQGGNGVAWNGITAVEDDTAQTLKSFWLDGVKYLDNLLPGDFSGKLKAFTYPDEFEQVSGIVSPSDGLLFYDQPSKSFNLSYRTRVGNDLEGIDHGYKIHLLYNLVANPDNAVYPTLTGTTATPIEFSWVLSGTPPTNPSSKGYRPTVHISIDSEDTSSEVLQAIEDILWGKLIRHHISRRSVKFWTSSSLLVRLSSLTTVMVLGRRLTMVTITSLWSARLNSRSITRMW